MAQDPTMPTYKQGILARKMHHDADGKKSKYLPPGTEGCVGRALLEEPVLDCSTQKNDQPVFLSWMVTECHIKQVWLSPDPSTPVVRQRLDKHTSVSFEGGRGLCCIWGQEEGEVFGSWF